jgi:sulfur-carrier protein
MRYPPAVPEVAFTGHLRRYLDVPTRTVPGATVRAALDAVFAAEPRLRGYVLEDQGGLRHHVVIYVNGLPIRDRIGLSDAVGPDDQVYVLQALSGG